MSDLRTLIVGAGIAGLGTARALRQRGFAAEVIERDAAWAHIGAGIYLPGNAARALHAGLESAVAEQAALIPANASVTTEAASWPRSTSALCGARSDRASRCTAQTFTLCWQPTATRYRSGWVDPCTG